VKTTGKVASGEVKHGRCGVSWEREKGSIRVKPNWLPFYTPGAAPSSWTGPRPWASRWAAFHLGLAVGQGDALAFNRRVKSAQKLYLIFLFNSMY
jgi:hypothetical protein